MSSSHSDPAMPAHIREGHPHFLLPSFVQMRYIYVDFLRLTYNGTKTFMYADSKNILAIVYYIYPLYVAAAATYYLT